MVVTDSTPHKRPTADEKWQGMPSDLWLEAHRACDASRDDMWDWLEDRYWNLEEQLEAARGMLDELGAYFDFDQLHPDLQDRYSAVMEAVFTPATTQIANEPNPPRGAFNPATNPHFEHAGNYDGTGLCREDTDPAKERQ